MGETWIKRKGGKKWHLMDAAITAERENHVWYRGRHLQWAGCGFVTGSEPSSQSTEERPKREQMCAHCRKSLPSGPSHTEIRHAAAVRLAKAVDAEVRYLAMPKNRRSTSAPSDYDSKRDLRRAVMEALAAWREVDPAPGSGEGAG